MAQKVYAHQKQYENTTQLEASIKAVWSEIEADYLFKLYRSIGRRFLAALDSKEPATKY